MRRLLLAGLLVVSGCASTDEVRFTAIDLSGTPESLAPHGNTLLVGTRAGDRPGLVARSGDQLTDVTVTPATPYGKEAHWYRLTSDGTAVYGVGGERGGAHGNVRWSAWTGDTRQLAEKTQGFSTFGGYGAGELLGVVRTSGGPLIVGTWQSDKAGLDAAVWTLAGDTWSRLPSAGTPLESSQETLRFPLAVTENGNGALVVGWQLANGTKSAAVWQFDGTTWTTTTLPDGDAALAARCWDGTCHVVGRHRGKLAWWRSGPTGWTRLSTKDVPVSDEDDLAAPVPVNGTPTLVVDHNGVKLVSEQEERPASGPAGEVTDAVVVNGEVFVIAGGKLWRLGN